MCDLYYLDHFRPETTDLQDEAIETNEKINAAVEAMRETLSSTARISERIAKSMLDVTFRKISEVDAAAQERLLRYAIELCRKLKHDFDADREAD